MGAATNCAGVDDVPGLVCQAPERPQARGISWKHRLTCVTAYSKVTPAGTGSNASGHLVGESASDRTRGAGSYRNQQVDELHRDGRTALVAGPSGARPPGAGMAVVHQAARKDHLPRGYPPSGVVSRLSERLGAWLVREGSAQGAEPLCGRESDSRS